VSDDLAVLAADAYVYGFALAFNLQEVRRVSQQGLGSVAPAPFNRFSHAAGWPGRTTGSYPSTTTPSTPSRRWT
jgi:hypothetical protein